MTNNLSRRLQEHNRGNSFATKSRAPFVLIYAEAYTHHEDAKTREKYLKSGWGRAHLKRVLQNYFRTLKI